MSPFKFFIIIIMYNLFCLIGWSRIYNKKKFKNMNYQVDYKIHPSLSFDNGLIRGVSSLVLENDGRFTLVSTTNNCSQKKYENPIDLLADYDVIISPAGSIILEAAIQNKTCIALAFGGLRFNYYGDIGIRAKHFSGLCHDYGLFVAYDFFQLHYFAKKLKQDQMHQRHQLRVHL